MADLDVATILQTVQNITDWDHKMTLRLIGYMRGNQDGNIHNVFFDGYPVKGLPSQLAAYQGTLTDLTKSYICRVMADIQEYQLHRMVWDVSRLQVEWEQKVNTAPKEFWEGMAMDTWEDILPQVEQNSIQYAGALAEQMKRTEWIQGMVAESVTAGTGSWRLMWLLEKSLDENMAWEVMEGWKQAGCEELVSTFPDYPWKDCVKTQLLSGSNQFQNIKKDIQKACEKKREVYREYKSELVGQTVSGAGGMKKYALVRYQLGKEVTDWIQQQSGYASGEMGEFPLKDVREAYDPLGCVLRGTRILNEEKRWVSMESLTEGMKILSAQRMPSVFSGELVENDRVAWVYAINEDTPFMSLDHMILTEEGYKCPDPEAAKRWNTNIAVSQLREGDMVLKYELDARQGIHIRKEEVRRIHIVPNESPCVDIHIEDGYKSYITESGYVCYANYPEITIRAIQKKLEKAKDPTLEEEWGRMLRQSQTLIEKLWGEDVRKYMERRWYSWEN
ncbi:MAG: hypothetical protein ACLU6B_07360 [Lachnospirales bacterium]